MAAKKAPQDEFSEFESDELMALIRLNMDKGDMEAALKKVKAVLLRNDKPNEALSVAARIYAQLGLFSKSSEYYSEFLAQEPEALVERFQLGMTHFDLGEIDQALKVWDEVLKRHEGHPPASYYKALVLSQKGEVATAVELLNGLLKTIMADNLYFDRSRELLAALKQSGRADSGIQSGKKANLKILPEDAYKTEH
jgi:tetratricopeptide (TPR) repeat protein